MKGKNEGFVKWSDILAIFAESIFCSQLQHRWVSCKNILDTLLWSRSKHRVCGGVSGAQLELNHDVGACVDVIWWNPLFSSCCLCYLCCSAFLPCSLSLKGMLSLLGFCISQTAYFMSISQVIIVKELMHASCIFKSSSLAFVVHSQDCEMMT